MATAHFDNRLDRNAPSPPFRKIASRKDAAISAAVISAVLFLLLILLALSWLAFADPSAFWMWVTLCFQAASG